MKITQMSIPCALTLTHSEEQSDSIVSDEFSPPPFDRLPDDVLMLIFNQLRDAKSLTLCTAICKRFRSLIAQTHSVRLSVPNCSPEPPHFDSDSAVSKRSHHPILAFANKLLVKPFRSLLRVLRSKASFSSASGCTCRNTVDDGFAGGGYYSPAHILRNFREIRRLELRLPRQIACVNEVCGGNSGGANLKWTAEYGGELQSCVIVGGMEISSIRENCGKSGDEDEGSGEELGVSESEELKVRILWTISCLIAASARHSLLRETMSEHRTVQNATVSDEIGQGRLTMSAKQIEEMRRNSYTKKAEEEDKKSVLTVDSWMGVPALKMKMWIAPELELPEEGYVMKGATLVAILPAEAAEEEEIAGVLDLLVSKVELELVQKEERVFAEAAKKLVKLKRSYTLEMNSF